MAGMSIEVMMPQMGESVVEGTVAKWLVKEGDSVQEDQPLVEISTDKVDTEIPSPGAGVIAKLVAAEGQTLAGRRAARGDRTSRRKSRRRECGAAKARLPRRCAAEQGRAARRRAAAAGRRVRAVARHAAGRARVPQGACAGPRRGRAACRLSRACAAPARASIGATRRW